MNITTGIRKAELAKLFGYCDFYNLKVLCLNKNKMFMEEFEKVKNNCITEQRFRKTFLIAELEILDKYFNISKLC